MNYRLVFLYTLYIFISSFLFSCANMVTPTGGLKDVDAPVLIKSKPKQQSTNFSGKEITLGFNEYLNLKDIQKQLIVSPGDIEIEVKKQGKNLILKLNKEPNPNTTYIINFGDAISDYTENNITKDFKYIFSTGNDIDSLELKGNILDAFKKEKVKDVIVCLYKNLVDSVVYNSRPDYTVRANDNGEYKFTNLKEGTYRIFCMKESNNNKLYDSEDEEIAFNDSLIELKGNVKLNSLLLFSEIPLKRKILNKNITAQKVEIILNKKNNIELMKIDSTMDTIVYSKNRDSINVYYKDKIDTSYLYLKEDNKIDTLRIKFPKAPKKSDLNISVENKIKGNQLLIKSNDLFRINMLDSLIIFEDSIKVNYNIKAIAYNIYMIEYNFIKEKNYKISIADSVFKSYNGSLNKSYQSKIAFYNDEDFGTVTFLNCSKNKIYELLNERSEIVRRSISNSENNIVYKNLLPGAYRLRIVNDNNKNGIWDSGNYLKKQQPEEVEYHLTPIKIRANWDLEIQLVKP